jgi:dipeptidyl aminopeptidase/acylaminoacyl peptidase
MIDVGTGKQWTLLQKNWDISYVSRTQSGRYWVMGVNNDARSDVYVYEADSAGTLKIDHLNKTVLDSTGISRVAFNPAEDAIAYYSEGGRTPGDIFYRLLHGSSGPVQLTRRLNEAIDEKNLVEPDVVRFASYDGVDVPGILYKPKQASTQSKVPALIWVHGGPGGQTRADWSALIQYLVNHGYAVYGINNRGSSGYGKTFFAMDDLKHGSADLDDCVASKKMLIGTGWVDPDRIGIIGGSYGGYMVCAALAFRPGVFEVGVDIFGVTNWVRTLKSIPPWWEAGRNSLYLELGDPHTQEEYLASISPLFHAKNIRDPMIVLQGKNDPRVLQVESDEMVEAVRANDVPVEYIIFPDEGHGFRKKANQIAGYEAVMRFLNTHLRGD